MSNKTDFQAKNTRLNANNTDLSSILETINNLPEASSGGGPTAIGGDLSNGFVPLFTSVGFVAEGSYSVNVSLSDGSTITETITLVDRGEEGYQGMGTTFMLVGMSNFPISFGTVDMIMVIAMGALPSDGQELLIIKQ